MATHLSARLAWHDDGWNGHICKKPAENTYCVGCYSYPGQMIAERRDLQWEKSKAGQPIQTLDQIPPCIYSANAFGNSELKAFADPPEFFGDDTQTCKWDLPAASVSVWPYEEMYGDEMKKPDGTYDYDKRREYAKIFFDKLTKNETLIFYYANYSNPLSQDEAKRYVLVGLSRLKDKGDELVYKGCSSLVRERFGGGFVWQRVITSHYPEEGLRLPYHAYRGRPEIMSQFAITPENPRTCKYGSRHLSNDDALGLIEQFLVSVNALQTLKDKTENWEIRKQWLRNLIAELWRSRGLFPGLPTVLKILKFDVAIPYFKAEVLAGREQQAYATIFKLIEGNAKLARGLELTEKLRQKISREWKLRRPDERLLLKDTFPRFDLTAAQMEAILSRERNENGIVASLAEIAKNPYIIAEQYVGNDPDDILSWGRIDRGALPSPELGGENLVELNDAKRLRALAIQCLRRETKHAFLPAPYLLNQINRHVAALPEYKQYSFTERYWKVDKKFLSKALHLQIEDDELYVYLRSNFEDERFVEAMVDFLISGPDIPLEHPATEKTWMDDLLDPRSVLAHRAPEAYRAAIEGQVEACKRVLVRPLTVLAGSAGTGKTTVIRAIVKAIKRVHGVGTPVIALAPTGKAADRIRETLEKDKSLKGAVETATIHSFLAKRGWLNPNMTLKRRGGRGEYGFSTYVIDECSMLDLSVAACLLRAINRESVQRMILVGDPSQLPPIGCGKLFADTIDYLSRNEPLSIATLKDNLRLLENAVSEQGTAILKLASGYVRESLAAVKDESLHLDFEKILKKVQDGGDVDKDLRVIYWNNAEELPHLLIQQMTNDMEKITGLTGDPERPFELWKAAFNNRAEAFQILTPYRGELFGIEAINLAVQRHIGEGISDRVGAIDGITFFDKVIQIRNRPKSNMAHAYNLTSRKAERIEIYNGELGFVKPHGFDGGKWISNRNFWMKRFQVVFSRKKNYWVNYGSELGNGENGRPVPRQPVADNLELAYAISVQKAQGSEFERTYVIVPKTKTALLSPELFYTALTRATRHCTLLVEQDVSALIDMRRPERSHLLKINSSLFAQTLNKRGS
jgi:exodeoxyribonuclease V alpha subunit